MPPSGSRSPGLPAGSGTLWHTTPNPMAASATPTHSHRHEAPTPRSTPVKAAPAAAPPLKRA